MAWGANYSIISGIIILSLFGSAQIAFAGDEYILTTGTGEGTLTVGVDGYGAFGNFVGDDSTNAMFQPVGFPQGGTTVVSGVAFRSIEQNNLVTTFLTSGNIFGSGIIGPNPIVSGTPTIGTSSFTHLGIQFDLVQTVTLTATGTTLTQTYMMTNIGSSAKEFSLIRHMDGDLLFVNFDVNDGGGRLVLDGTEILFETDETGTSSEDTSFIGITSEGGTVTDDRYEINNFIPFVDSIVNRINTNVDDPLFDNIIFGDTGPIDSFIDGSGFDVTLGLRNEFSLAAGETAVYVTKTVFGSGPPEDVEIDPPTELVGGILSPIDTVALLLAGAQSITWIIPVSLSILGIGLVLVKGRIH